MDDHPEPEIVISQSPNHDMSHTAMFTAMPTHIFDNARCDLSATMLRRSKTLVPRLAALSQGRNAVAAERLVEGPAIESFAGPLQATGLANGRNFRGETVCDSLQVKSQLKQQLFDGE